MSFPEPHIHDATTAHAYTIILLHGRGSNGPEFAKEFFEARTSSGLNLAEHFPSWRWVFPSAKARLSTIFGEKMTEWFDTYSLSDINAESHLQVEGLGEAVRFILDLIEEEAKCVGAAEKVVLGGVSQGEATALQAFLCGQRRLGAFVGASGWFPFAGQVEAILRESEGSEKQVAAFLRNNLGLGDWIATSSAGLGLVLETPVFLGHGADDVWVDLKLGKQARDILKSMGIDVTWRKYIGAEEDGHWLKETEEFDDIVKFLKEKVICI
ncbi:hypothetical protein Q9L58_003010 [Maublancomyces gigas]|uniref:Phospholipase/carboxylesterase/thioesterase domain-containing protein n=1 Tax=Discina gigas TaxID=1032678 RepID=A0ABR3GQC3_9PEZI